VCSYQLNTRDENFYEGMITMKQQKTHKIGTKLTIYFLVITFIASALLFTLMYSESYKMLVNNVGGKALQVSKIAAESIDVAELVKIQTVADTKTQRYSKMRNDLDYIRKIADAKYIYLMRKNQNGEAFHEDKFGWMRNMVH